MINKKNIKLIVFSVLAIGCYVLAFYALFGQIQVLFSMLYFLIFFIVFHFLCIEIHPYPFKYLAGLVGIFALVFASVLGHGNLRSILSIFALNAGILALGYALKNELDSKIRFSSLSYFSLGGYLFIVFMTIGYGISLIGLYTTFPFTCTGLDAASNSVITTVSKPFKIGLQEVQNIKNQAKIFFGSNVGEALKIGSQLKATPNPGVLGRLSSELVNQIKTENVSTSMGICDYLLVKVNEKFGKPEFAVSLIFLLFLLLYPFVRIVFRVMSLIAYVLFKILYLAGLYEVKTVEKELESIN